MNFQKIVLVIASLLLIISLTFIGYTLYYHKFNKKFPPVIAECPDFWKASKKGICENPRGLGNNNCRGAMNFNQNRFQGHDGNCNKAKWANHCGVSWSGITNDPNICKNINN